ITPDETLRTGRHELAVFAEEIPRRTKKKNTAIERSRIAFDNADHHMNAVTPCDCGEIVHARPRDVDRGFPILTICVPSFVAASANVRSKHMSLGIAAHE